MLAPTSKHGPHAPDELPIEIERMSLAWTREE